eukprot:c54096_g1_i1.p2 GENE.c54096_g1_i1~~c54096_g1_i1.p2  ORF type:complete len:145 (+),score=21.94 c54096_g1_i1:595-1029(+)
MNAAAMRTARSGLVSPPVFGVIGSAVNLAAARRDLERFVTEQEARSYAADAALILGAESEGSPIDTGAFEELVRERLAKVGIKDYELCDFHVAASRYNGNLVGVTDPRAAAAPDLAPVVSRDWTLRVQGAIDAAIERLRKFVGK